jgi:hypothetical protein
VRPIPFAVRHCCRGRAIAKEQAALAALAALEQRHSRIFGASTAGAPASVSEDREHNDQGAANPDVACLSSIEATAALELLAAGTAGADSHGTSPGQFLATNRSSSVEAPTRLSNHVPLADKDDPMETNCKPAAREVSVQVLKPGLQGALRASNGCKVKVSPSILQDLDT